MQLIDAKFAYVHNQLLRDIQILVEDGRILKVGRELKGGKRLDARDKVVFPAFVSAHTHLTTSFIRGMGEGLPTAQMFQRVLFPAEKMLDSRAVYYASLLSCYQLLLNGITAVGSVSLFADGLLEALQETGMKANLAIAVKDQRTLKENIKLIKETKKNPRLRAMFGIANEYETPDKLFSEVSDLAAEEGTGIHIHLAESLAHAEYSKKKYRKSSIAYADSKGILNERTLIAHAVHVSDQDLEIIKKRGCTVAHCPSSNVNSFNGIARVSDMLEDRIGVCIGLDNPSVNVSVDLKKEMRVAKMLQRLLGKNLKDRFLMEMNSTGAKALGFPCGEIIKGNSADLVFMDLNDPNIIPFSLGTALYSGQVDSVMLDGKFVVKDKKLIGSRKTDRIRKKAVDFCQKLRKKVC